MRTLCFLLLLNFSLFSQEIKLPNNIVHSLEVNDVIKFFTKKEIYSVKLENYEISEAKTFNNNGFDITHYTPLFINKYIYFIHKSSGLVLKLTNNELIRIDNSYDHKLQMWSSIFNYKNNLYRFGGYGFFSARNFILKYDFETNEWEYVKLQNTDKPTPRFDNSFILKEDKLIIIGGITVDKLNANKKNPLKDSWVFSFKELSWKKVATSNYFQSFNSSFFLLNKQIGAISNDKVYVYDYEKKQIKTYELSPLLLKYNRKYKIYYFNNLLHFVISRNNDELVLLSRTKKEFFGNPIKTDSIGNSQKIIFRTIMFLIALVILCFLVYFGNEILNKIVVSKNNIYFKSYTVSLTKDELRVIKEFIRKKLHLENQRLQEILYKNQYDRSHNIRLKNNFVSSLNSKFQYILKNNKTNFIKVEKSSYDKRFKNYYLDFKQKRVVERSRPPYLYFIYLFISFLSVIVLWLLHENQSIIFAI